MDEEALGLAAKRIGKLVALSHKAAWDPEDVAGEQPELTGEEAAALAKVLSLIYWSDKSGQVSLVRMAGALEGEAWRTGFPGRLGDSAEFVHLRDVAVEYLMCQRDDEVRHALAIEHLMAALDVDIGPPTPVHSYVLSRLAWAPDFDEKLVLIHWLIEIFAKVLFDELRERFPDTSVARAMDRIIADESRHVAFGDLFLPVRARTAPPAALASLVKTQVSGLAVMSAAFWLDGFQQAARVLNLDVRKFFFKGMDALERRYNQFGRPAAILNFAPIAKPLLALLL